MFKHLEPEPIAIIDIQEAKNSIKTQTIPISQRNPHFAHLLGEHHESTWQYEAHRILGEAIERMLKKSQDLLQNQPYIRIAEYKYALITFIKEEIWRFLELACNRYKNWKFFAELYSALEHEQYGYIEQMRSESWGGKILLELFYTILKSNTSAPVKLQEELEECACRLILGQLYKPMQEQTRKDIDRELWQFDCITKTLKNLEEFSAELNKLNISLTMQKYLLTFLNQNYLKDTQVHDLTFSKKRLSGESSPLKLKFEQTTIFIEVQEGGGVAVTSTKYIETIKTISDDGRDNNHIAIAAPSLGCTSITYLIEQGPYNKTVNSINPFAHIKLKIKQSSPLEIYDANITTEYQQKLKLLLLERLLNNYPLSKTDELILKLLVKTYLNEKEQIDKNKINDSIRCEDLFLLAYYQFDIINPVHLKKLILSENLPYLLALYTRNKDAIREQLKDSDLVTYLNAQDAIDAALHDKNFKPLENLITSNEEISHKVISAQPENIILMLYQNQKLPLKQSSHAEKVLKKSVLKQKDRSLWLQGFFESKEENLRDLINIVIGNPIHAFHLSPTEKVQILIRFPKVIQLLTKNEALYLASLDSKLAKLILAYFKSKNLDERKKFTPKEEAHLLNQYPSLLEDFYRTTPAPLWKRLFFASPPTYRIDSQILRLALINPDGRLNLTLQEKITTNPSLHARLEAAPSFKSLNLMLPIETKLGLTKLNKTQIKEITENIENASLEDLTLAALQNHALLEKLIANEKIVKKFFDARKIHLLLRLYHAKVKNQAQEQIAICNLWQSAKESNLELKIILEIENALHSTKPNTLLKLLKDKKNRHYFYQILNFHHDDILKYYINDQQVLQWIIADAVPSLLARTIKLAIANALEANNQAACLAQLLRDPNAVYPALSQIEVLPDSAILKLLATPVLHSILTADPLRRPAQLAEQYANQQLYQKWPLNKFGINVKQTDITILVEAAIKGDPLAAIQLFKRFSLIDIQSSIDSANSLDSADKLRNDDDMPKMGKLLAQHTKLFETHYPPNPPTNFWSRLKNLGRRHKPPQRYNLSGKSIAAALLFLDDRERLNSPVLNLLAVDPKLRRIMCESASPQQLALIFIKTHPELRTEMLVDPTIKDKLFSTTDQETLVQVYKIIAGEEKNIVTLATQVKALIGCAQAEILRTEKLTLNTTAQLMCCLQQVIASLSVRKELNSNEKNTLTSIYPNIENTTILEILDQHLLQYPNFIQILFAENKIPAHFFTAKNNPLLQHATPSVLFWVYKNSPSDLGPDTITNDMLLDELKKPSKLELLNNTEILELLSIHPTIFIQLNKGIQDNLAASDLIELIRQIPEIYYHLNLETRMRLLLDTTAEQRNTLIKSTGNPAPILDLYLNFDAYKRYKNRGIKYILEELPYLLMTATLNIGLEHIDPLRLENGNLVLSHQQQQVLFCGKHSYNLLRLSPAAWVTFYIKHPENREAIQNQVTPKRLMAFLQEQKQYDQIAQLYYIGDPFSSLIMQNDKWLETIFTNAQHMQSLVTLFLALPQIQQQQLLEENFLARLILDTPLENVQAQVIVTYEDNIIQLCQSSSAHSLNIFKHLMQLFDDYLYFRQRVLESPKLAMVFFNQIQDQNFLEETFEKTPSYINRIIYQSIQENSLQAWNNTLLQPFILKYALRTDLIKLYCQFPTIRTTMQESNRWSDILDKASANELAQLLLANPGLHTQFTQKHIQKILDGADAELLTQLLNHHEIYPLFSEYSNFEVDLQKTDRRNSLLEVKLDKNESNHKITLAENNKVILTNDFLKIIKMLLDISEPQKKQKYLRKHFFLIDLPDFSGLVQDQSINCAQTLFKCENPKDSRPSNENPKKLHEAIPA